MISLGTIKDRIDPHRDAIVDAAKASTGKWQTFLSEKPELALPLGPSERAGFIHAHFRAQLTAKFLGHESVRPSMRPGFFVLVIDDGLLVRPKFCGRGAPSNVQTDTQKLLSYQQYSPELMEALSFDGVLEPPTLVTLGYTLNGPDLARLFVLRECRGWATSSFDLYGGTAVAEQRTLPGIDEPKPARVASTRVRPAQEHPAEQQ